VKLVLATANEGKVLEFRRALPPDLSELVSARELGVTAFPEETGTSYAANALTKAAFVAGRTGLPSLADDSGLEVDALGGAPGLYSARFGGLASDRERTAHLLEQLRGVPEGGRGARFVCVLGLVTPAGDAHAFEGCCEGVITTAPRGDGGFGYDPVFWSPELGKTFAEATPEEKAAVSHRGRALAKLAAWLQRERL
jgi:XTP/dITP diphosphohydrolase